MDITSIVESLENGSYLNYGINETTEKIEKFTQWLNGLGRVNLLKYTQNETKQKLNLLSDLQKIIECTIDDLENIKHKQKIEPHFKCTVCNKIVKILSIKNIWDSLENHDHFIDHFINQNDRETKQLGRKSNKSLIKCGQTNNNTSEISNNIDKVKPKDFKFNFVLNYDSKIANLLYPKNLTAAAKKSDKLEEYSVIRINESKAYCLLCSCLITSKIRRSKISPYLINNHTSGHRHIKLSTQELYKSALKNFHDFWRSQDLEYQSHQVYFYLCVPAVDVCRCSLCGIGHEYSELLSHIDGSLHKNKVMQLYNKNESYNHAYVMELQLKSYGIETPTKENENPKNSVAENHCVILRSFIYSSHLLELNLPNRFKHHAKFFKKEDELILCECCNIDFKFEPKLLRLHVQDSKHLNLAKLPKLQYKYFCEICNQSINNEDEWVDHFNKGPNRHAQASTTRRDMHEYECITCLLVIYGDNLSLDRHLSQKKGNKEYKDKNMKLPLQVKNMFKSALVLENEAKKLASEATQVFQCEEIMDKCCKNLEDVFSEVYPKCKAYPFGSRVSGFGNNMSDLDIFMDVGDMYNGNKNQDPHNQEQIVKKCATILKRYKEDFHYVLAIPSARTPIIRLHHAYTSLDCDVSFRHGLGVENTKFLKFCVTLQPITQPFVLLLKKWSCVCNLNDHITNYGLSLMAIFYLQTKGYLPSVKFLRDSAPQEIPIINGWQTLNYLITIGKWKQLCPPYPFGLKQLLREFFCYFSTFNFNNDVICPLLGCILPKKLFNGKGELLPHDMYNYIKKIQNDDGEVFRNLSEFCVQDPFDLSHNITKSCQHSIIWKFKRYCELTLEHLNTID